MNITTVESKRAGEQYYVVEHPSGLHIMIYPKPGFHSAYTVFGTRYGSIDTRFRRSDESDVSEVPAGIAHFLEHKLFENEDCDAFARYAKTGASANAYTSFDMTCYLFSCTRNVYDSLEILLDFVQAPYFTEQTIEKEQGIIGQEIRMYEDDPSWRGMFNLLRSMYHVHPVKTDIAGTVESIASITPEMLYRCYNTFYNLHNMVLCIAGNVEVEKALEVADRVLKPCDHVEVERAFPQEPSQIVQPYIEERLPVLFPLFQFGFKEELDHSGEAGEAEIDILLELMASDASPLFRSLLDQGLVNESSFGYDHFAGTGYNAILFSGESRDPKAVAKAICDEAERLRREGIGKDAFSRAQKAVYGRTLSALNSSDSIANGMASLYFRGQELFRYIDAVASATVEDVQRRLEKMMRAEYSALSVILPKEETKRIGGNKS